MFIGPVNHFPSTVHASPGVGFLALDAPFTLCGMKAGFVVRLHLRIDHINRPKTWHHLRIAMNSS